jgi:hypothetical protein
MFLELVPIETPYVVALNVLTIVGEFQTGSFVGGTKIGERLFAHFPSHLQPQSC